MKKILFILLVLSFASIHSYANDNTNNFINYLQSDLNKIENKNSLQEYEYLKSLGWKIIVNNKQKKMIEVLSGNPLNVDSYTNLKSSNQHLSIYIKNSDTTLFTKIIDTLKKSIFPKAVKSFSTTAAWKMKFSDSLQKTKNQLKENLIWPYNNEDALGSGWTPYFKKISPSKSELDQLCKDHGCETAADRDYLGSLLSFWYFKTNKKVTRISSALKSIFTKEHTSGCLIALNTFMHLSVFNSYADNINVFDKSFNEIKINNQIY